MLQNDAYDVNQEPVLVNMKDILGFSNNSPNTQKAYLTYTRPFLEYCHYVLQKDPLLVTHNDIRGFLGSLQDERDLSNRTVNHAMSEIKKMLVVSGYDWDDLQVPKKKFSSPTLYVPPKSRMQELLNSVTDPKKKAMLSVMYGTGARVSETCHLKCKDIHVLDKVIHIDEGKGGTGRDVPLPDITYQHIKKYWLELPASKKTRDWLFPQDRNLAKPADVEYIEKFLKRHIASMGWMESITPHTLRRAFATHLYIRGETIERISRLLGHKSIQSTLIYVHLGEAILAQTTKSPIDDLNLLV